MNEKLFGRKTELIVGGKQYVNDLTNAGLDVYFDIPFDDDKEPNVGTIQVYNLSNSSIQAIKEKTPVVLNAGYQNDVGSIFLGFINTALTQWETVDKLTTIQAIDGNDAWLNTPINKTYKAGMTGQAILTDLLSLTGLEIGAFTLGTNKVYRSGKTIKTSLSKALAEVAADCGSKSHVTRGKIYIQPKNAGQTLGFVVNSETGLIGSPTPIITDRTIKVPNGKDVQEKRYGYKVITLLNHRISTDAILQIESKTANGLFRVESGRHYGNASDFHTEMEVYPV